MTASRKERIVNRFMGIGFMGYALILTIERILALIFSPTQGGDYSLSSGYYFPYITYILTIASLLVGLAFFARPIANMLLAFLHKEDYDFKGNSKRLAKAVGTLLIGGMMHTGFTLAWLQFIAYGFLIMALIVRCILSIQDGVSKWDSIISLIYLVCFSMAIPVCYNTKLVNWIGYAFYISEFIASLSLILSFSVLFYRYFNEGKFSFDWYYIVGMLVLDGLVIGFKWVDEINYFLLIFVILSLLTYLIEFIRKKSVK